jgi:hypothetical protein
MIFSLFYNKNIGKMLTTRLVTSFLFGSILLITTLAQAQSTVTYDFDKNSFDKEIPFDELITFKFINIPDSTKEIILSIQEVPRKNVKLEGSADPYCTDSLIKDLKIRPIKLKIDSLSISKTDSTAQKVCPYYFSPNRNYIFSIKTEIKQRPLNDKEKSMLKDKLIKSGLVANQLSYFIKESFKIGNKDDNRVSFIANTVLDNIRKKSDSIVVSFYGKDAEFIYDDKILYAENLKMIEFAEPVLNLSDAIKNFQIDLDLMLKDPAKKLDAALYSKINEKIDSTKSVFKEISFFAPDGFKVVKDQTNKLKNLLRTQQLPVEPISEWESYIDEIEGSTMQFLDICLQDVILNQVIMREFVAATYPKGLVEQSRNYIAADLGAAYVGPLDKFVFFSCASIYFRPVKRSIPLRQYRHWDDFLLSRVSLDVGITLSSISKPNEIQGFAFKEQNDSDKGLMLGLGFRILPFLKLNGGSMVYRADDPNPMIKNLSYKASWYFGAAIDFEVSALFKATFSGKKSAEQE